MSAGYSPYLECVTYVSKLYQNFFFKIFFLFSLILSTYRQLYRYPNRIRIGLDEVPLPAIDRHSFFLAFVDCQRWSSSSPFLTICLLDSHSLSLALPCLCSELELQIAIFFLFLFSCSLAQWPGL